MHCSLHLSPLANTCLGRDPHSLSNASLEMQFMASALSFQRLHLGSKYTQSYAEGGDDSLIATLLNRSPFFYHEAVLYKRKKPSSRRSRDLAASRTYAPKFQATLPLHFHLRTRYAGPKVTIFPSSNRLSDLGHGLHELCRADLLPVLESPPSCDSDFALCPWVQPD